MKLMHEHIDFPGRSTIKVKWRDTPYFTYPWHSHSEFELTYVIKSYGTRYVGDNIEKFGPGDLVLIGCNMPHFWKSDEDFYKGRPELSVNAIIIQFHSDFFINALNNYPEFFHIKKLLSLSTRGIRFLEPVVKKMDKMLRRMLEVSGFERIILMLQILNELASTDSYDVLGSEAFPLEMNGYSNDRLDKVINFLNFHYREKITLEKVSDLAGYHPSAFCRFFKEKSGKSLSEYLNDMRIGYACKLLIEGNLTVSQICFECGFNNLSNFNRTFRRLTKFTPTEYQQQFHLQNKRMFQEMGL